jgi:hypothetical protein
MLSLSSFSLSLFQFVAIAAYFLLVAVGGGASRLWLACCFQNKRIFKPFKRIASGVNKIV